MQSKYILNAVQAMKDAERLSRTMEPFEFGRIKANLIDARIDLEIYSGIQDVEISVEPDEISATDKYISDKEAA